MLILQNTVVIFDRVRENLRKYSDVKIYELTNISINETLSRTLITSITTLLAIINILFGGEIKRFFTCNDICVIFGLIHPHIVNTVLVRLSFAKTVLRR